MKRKWMAVAVLLGITLLAFLVIALRADSEPEHTIESWFAGFTNTADGPIGRVAIHIKPESPMCVWPGSYAQRLNAGVWERWTPPPGDARPATEIKDYEDWYGNGPDGRCINLYFNFAVENTNDAWRLMVGVHEYPRDRGPAIQLLLNFWDHWTLPPPHKAFRSGPHYFLTNETRRVN